MTLQAPNAHKKFSGLILGPMVLALVNHRQRDKDRPPFQVEGLRAPARPPQKIDRAEDEACDADVGSDERGMAARFGGSV
jgi:hypothetical protein